MEELSRDNHYVPQFYLNYWGNKDKVFLYRLLVSHEKVPEWEEKKVSGIAFQTNLYIRLDGEQESDSFEKFFNWVYETDAKEVFCKIDKDEKLTPEDWEKLINYICAQYVRTPVFYFRSCDIYNTIVPKTIEATAQKFRNANSEELKKVIDSSDMSELMPFEVGKPYIDPIDNHCKANFNITIGKGSWLYAIKTLLNDNSQFKTGMHNLKWSIIATDSSVPIPTCDNPVVVAEIGDDGVLSVTNNGFYDDNKFVIFPLSPNKVLLGSKTRYIRWRETANRDFSLTIKELILYNAFLEVYSNREDFQVPLIRKRKVDAVEFNRIKTEFQNWHNIYKKTEGQYHSQRKKTNEEV